MLNSDKILKIINEKQHYIKKFGVKSIGLFGSYATNNQKPESDIDFLVEFKKGKKTFDNYMDLKFYLENLFECNIDLVVKEALKVDLKSNILKSVKYAAGL
jgi:predicted nucleotidyltransferase